MALKVFNFLCSNGHLLEGWLKSDLDWKAESAAGRLACPVCGGAVLEKRPSAPSVARVTGTTRTDVTEDLESRRDRELGARQREAYEALRRAVRDAEDVGRNFKEEARALADGRTSRPGGIRGLCTEADAEELRSEGIPVFSVPDELLKDGN